MITFEQLLKVHDLTFGPLVVKKTCILRKNIVLVVLCLCMNVLLNMVLSHK